MDQVGKLLSRPKLYYNIDGVGELGAGFTLLVSALLIWLQTHSPVNAVWHRMYVVVVYVAVMLAVIRYGSKWIKERITYPRTGFVEYRRRDRWGNRAVAAAFASTTVLGIVMAARKNWDTTASAALIGLVLAAVYGYRIARTVPWKWAVVLAMTLGSLVIAFLASDAVGTLANNLVTTVLPAKTEAAFLLTLMLFGAILLVSGGISLCLYLRHTQAPLQETQ